jgi:metal-responsive CopG/Arc/MetJ family transcriptional regulator
MEGKEKDKRKEQVGIQLERWMIKALKHRAIDEGVSMSELIRRMVREYLENEE